MAQDQLLRRDERFMAQALNVQRKRPKLVMCRWVPFLSLPMK